MARLGIIPPPPPPFAENWTLDELAGWARITRRMLSSLRNDPQFPPGVKVTDGTLRFVAAEVKAWWAQLPRVPFSTQGGGRRLHAGNAALAARSRARAGKSETNTESAASHYDAELKGAT